MGKRIPTWFCFCSVNSKCLFSLQLSEKVRKKQESIVLLQEEKEHLYTDNMRLQEEIKQMAADKQRELADQKETFSASVEEKMREIDSLKLFSNSRIKELEDIISSLNREVRSCMVTKCEVTNSLIRNAYLKTAVSRRA